MAIHRLTVTKVAQLIRDKSNGMHADGGGLYPQIQGGSRSWLVRYKPLGSQRSRYMGLGSLNDVGLGEGRDKALANRKLKEDGIKTKNPAAPAVRREAEEEWRR